MHPDVVGEADVEQVREGLTTDGPGKLISGRRAIGRGIFVHALTTRGQSASHSAIERVSGDVDALTYLDLVHAVPPVLPTDLFDDRATGPHLTDELAHRSLARGGADHVGGDPPHVPPLAVARAGPVVRAEAAELSRELLALDSRDRHRLVVLDARDRGDIRRRGRGHDDSPLPFLVVPLRLLVAFCAARRRRSMSAKNMSTTRRECRTQRSPPGSFATCWSASPATSAVNTSKSLGIGHARGDQPCAAELEELRPPDAYEAGDGSKPGIGRWNNSWWRTMSSVANCTNRCTISVAATPRIRAELSGGDQVEELLVPFGEHRVVEVVLRFEVGVERRLPELHHVGELTQRDPGEPVSVRQRPRRGQDLRPLCVTSLRPPVDRRRAHLTHWVGGDRLCRHGLLLSGSITDRFSIGDQNTRERRCQALLARMSHSPRDGFRTALNSIGEQYQARFDALGRTRRRRARRGDAGSLAPPGVAGCSCRHFGLGPRRRVRHRSGRDRAGPPRHHDGGRRRRRLDDRRSATPRARASSGSRPIS